MLRKLILFVLMVFFSAGVVRSHPHVWIENSVGFSFNAKKKITKIIHRWEFDPMLSAAIAKDYKAGKDGTFTARRAKKMLKEAFGWLGEEGYLTHIYVNGEKVFADALEGFRPEMKNGALVCTFSITFKKPLDPFKDSIEVAVYDPQYYYDMVFGVPPVFLEGIKPAACRYELFEDEERAEYFGLIIPETVRLCLK